MKALPTALVIGPMKAGTTWIHDYLDNRGDVQLPLLAKETFFFDRYWDRGVSWYASCFVGDGSSTSAWSIEVGPSYFHDPNVPERVYETLGNVPILVTLRDPVKRAWSHYLHLRRYGWTRAPLHDAVDAFPEIIEASRYQTCLARWYGYFPREAIHFVWQDTLKASPDTYARAVCDVFGVEFKPVPEELKGASNQASVPASATLASLGTAVKLRLRDAGLNQVINGAKRLGLKRVFYGKPGSGQNLKPSDEELAWLQSQLVDEIPPEAESARERAAEAG